MASLFQSVGKIVSVSVILMLVLRSHSAHLRTLTGTQLRTESRNIKICIPLQFQLCPCKCPALYNAIYTAQYIAQYPGKAINILPSYQHTSTFKSSPQKVLYCSVHKTTTIFRHFILFVYMEMTAQWFMST